MRPGKWHMRDPDAKRRESWALLLNAAATPRNGRTRELASALHRLHRCLLGMLPFAEGCQLRRWTGIAGRTREARLEHSLHRQDGRKEMITNHREANANGKPYMADTDAPNKLEPRIDGGSAPGIARTECEVLTRHPEM
jgi:hypothetical protein